MIVITDRSYCPVITIQNVANTEFIICCLLVHDTIAKQKNGRGN